VVEKKGCPPAEPTLQEAFEFGATGFFGSVIPEDGNAADWPAAFKEYVDSTAVGRAKMAAPWFEPYFVGVPAELMIKALGCVKIKQDKEKDLASSKVLSKHTIEVALSDDVSEALKPYFYPAGTGVLLSLPPQETEHGPAWDGSVWKGSVKFAAVPEVEVPTLGEHVDLALVAAAADGDQDPLQLLASWSGEVSEAVDDHAEFASGVVNELPGKSLSTADVGDDLLVEKFNDLLQEVAGLKTQLHEAMTRAAVLEAVVYQVLAPKLKEFSKENTGAPYGPSVLAETMKLYLSVAGKVAEKEQKASNSTFVSTQYTYEEVYPDEPPQFAGQVFCTGSDVFEAVPAGNGMLEWVLQQPQKLTVQAQVPADPPEGSKPDPPKAWAW
jgi:hypothetical protein